MAKPRTILLVEDNRHDVALAEAAFARLGADYRLVTAEDGERALERMLGGGMEHRSRPDLVLLDLELPGIDGFEVLRRIRADADTRLIPVVVFTSSMEDRYLCDSYRLGANSYLRKPADFERYFPLLRDVLHYWFRLNQSPPPG
jgi:two-component system, response regulator